MNKMIGKAENYFTLISNLIFCKKFLFQIIDSLLIGFDHADTIWPFFYVWLLQEHHEKNDGGPCSTLFIANLGPNCNEDELKEVLCKWVILAQRFCNNL